MPDGLTLERIRDLRHEAARFGDIDQVLVCDRAERGDYAAQRECARVIAAAKAAN